MDTLKYNIDKSQDLVHALNEIDCFEEWLKTLPPKGHFMNGDWVDDDGESLVNN